MLGFLFGVVVGAVGFWIYRFWKGEDTSWDQSFSTTGTTPSTYSTHAPEAAGGTTTSGVGTESTRPPEVTP
jgi:hypothetical protein